MKIVICSITDSGIYRVRSELITKLIDCGHSITVITPETSFREKLIGLGCDFKKIDIDSRGKNLFNDLRLYRKYIKLLKEEKPDIVLTFTTKPNIYCNIACRKLKIPSIANITGMGRAFVAKGFLPKIMLFLYKKAFDSKYIRTVFFQNNYSKEFFEQHNIGDPTRFKLIPGSGVNLSKFVILPYPKDETRINFLFIARVMKEKGIVNFVEAAARIRATRKNVFFHVLGDCEKEMEQFVRDNSQSETIVYHGRVDNVIDYLAMSNCTIHPSFYPEGMSNVILESAACGRPVITTNHPGCKEGVGDGVTGFIFEPKNTDDLVLKIEEFLALPYSSKRKMGLAARAKMENEFDRSIVVEAYQSAVSDVGV